MDFRNNPAGRILAAFATLKERPPSESAFEAWCNVFGTAAGHTDFSERFYGSAFQLAKQLTLVRDMAKGLPESSQGDLFLEPLHQYQGAIDAFVRTTQMNVEQFSAMIDARAQLSLEFFERALRQEPEIGVKENTSLREKIDDVYDAVASSNLDPEAKDFILQRLLEIDRALRDSFLTGLKPVEAATDSLIGGLTRNPGLLAALEDEPSSPGRSGISLRELLGTLLAVIITALGIHADMQALMPADAPQPTVVQIENKVDVDVDPEVKVQVEAHGDDGEQPDNGELVDEPSAPEK
jgi:hypothetical protein